MHGGWRGPAGATKALGADRQLKARNRKKRKREFKAAGAKFPGKDPAFDAAKRQARWKSIQTRGKATLEKRHANYLAPGYRPNKDWWGSAPVD